MHHQSPSSSCALLLFTIAILSSLEPTFTMPCGQPIASLQVGTYELQINDNIYPFCHSVAVQLEGKGSNATSLGTFGRIQQSHGVLYGKKSFSVGTKYNPSTHRLSIMVNVRQKYELSKMQIVYMISNSPQQNYLGTHILEQWRWQSNTCEGNMTYKGQTQAGKYQKGIQQILNIGVPNLVYQNIANGTKKAITMLSGMHCPTLNCSAFITSSEMVDSHTLRVGYEFSIAGDIFSSSSPLQIHFSYIIYENSPRARTFAYTETLEPAHTNNITSNGKKFNNNIIQDYPNTDLASKALSSNYGVNDITNSYSVVVGIQQIQIGLCKRIETVLNWFSLIRIESRLLKAIKLGTTDDGTCLSKSKCSSLRGVIRNVTLPGVGVTNVCMIN